MNRALFVVLLSLVAIAPVRALGDEEAVLEDAEEGLLFYGIVTVRDGEAIFVINPELSEEEAELCASRLAEKLPLGEAFDDYGRQFLWGDEKPALPTGTGQVPYIAYFLCRGGPVQTDNTVIEPPVGSWRLFNDLQLLRLHWWAPATMEQCGLSFSYFESGREHEEVVVLEGDEIAVGAEGTSPCGVTWRITGIEKREPKKEKEQDPWLQIVMETGEEPAHHEFLFFCETEKYRGHEIRCAAETRGENNKNAVWNVVTMAHELDELLRFVIREKDPGKLKRFEVKGFRFEPE